MKRLILLFCFMFLPLIGLGETIKWNPSSGDVDGYTLYWWADEGDTFCTSGEKCMISVPEDVVEIADMESILGLLYGVEYKFVVRGYNERGESGDSNIVSYVLDPYRPPLDRLRQSQGKPGEASILIEE